MARYRQSLALTSRYSRQLERTAARVQRLAEARWNLAPEDFDGSYSRWLDVVVPAVTQAQKQNQRLTTAYLTAYITSETGVRARLKTVGSVAGKNEDGRDLREAWDVPPIRAKQALMEGKELPVAMDIARASAMGLIGLGVYAGARVPMAEMLDATEQTVGYTRVTGGNPCAACMGAADGTVFATDEVFEIHPSCFPAGTRVSGPLPAAATKRWYVGDLIEIRLDGGGFLSVTPNHPILTPTGWVAAGDLREGSDVVRDLPNIENAPGVPDYDERPALIEQVAESLRRSPQMASASVPGSTEQFHGDGAGGNVNVVAANRFLKGGGQAAISEGGSQLPLCIGCAGLIALTSLSGLDLSGEWSGASSAGLVGGFGLGAALLRRHLRGPQLLSFAHAPNLHAPLNEPPADHDTLNVQPFADSQLGLTGDVGVHDFIDGNVEALGTAGDIPSDHFSPERAEANPGLSASLAKGLAGEIQRDCVVELRRVGFRGHVFNLQTDVGWYKANGVIVHNCDCVAEPVIDGIEDRVTRPTGQEVFDGLTEAEQNDRIGEAAADAVRGGTPLKDFIGHVDTNVGANWIIQRPLKDVA